VPSHRRRASVGGGAHTDPRCSAQTNPADGSSQTDTPLSPAAECAYSHSTRKCAHAGRPHHHERRQQTRVGASQLQRCARAQWTGGLRAAGRWREDRLTRRCALGSLSVYATGRLCTCPSLSLSLPARCVLLPSAFPLARCARRLHRAPPSLRPQRCSRASTRFESGTPARRRRALHGGGHRLEDDTAPRRALHRGAPPTLLEAIRCIAAHHCAGAG
jgi:hypothetical protein